MNIDNQTLVFRKKIFKIRLQEIEAEFDRHVSIKDITNQQLDVDSDAVVYIYNYWKLKRRVSSRFLFLLYGLVYACNFLHEIDAQITQIFPGLKF